MVFRKIDNKSNLISAIVFFGILFLTVYIYWSGLGGIFLVDDTYNLNTLNAQGGVTDFNSFLAFVFGNNSGVLGRPVAMLSFLIDDQYYPGDVWTYRYTNLLIHCLCGVFVFLLARQLLTVSEACDARQAIQISLVAMAWWLFSPLHVSTTLYIIQRMTQLATLFVLIGLCLYLYGRQLLPSNLLKGRILAAIGIYIFGGFAVLSKENGALIFLFALVTELAISYSKKERSDRVLLGVLLVPLVVGGLYFLLRWSALTGSGVRDFSVWERLMTEARILWDYMLKILLPVTGGMGLVHDDIEISRGLFSPVSTIISIIAHLLLVTLAIAFRKRYVWIFFAVCGFYFGHLLESTVIPLELYFEHRNYLPAVFICIGVAAQVWLLAKDKVVVKVGFVLLLGVFALVCEQRAGIWGDPKAQINIWAMEHPESIRAQTMMARSLIAEKNYEAAEFELLRLKKKWPRLIQNDLVILNQVCAGNMDVDISLVELYKRMDDGKYDGSLPSIFEETFRLYKVNRCDLIDGEVMDNLFKRVYLLENAAHTFKAKAAFWEVEYHAGNGYLEGAIQALDKTFSFQKDSYIIFLKGVMLYSAGLHEMALKEIDNAIIFERENGKFYRDNLKKYIQYKESVEMSLKGESPVNATN